jgi:hypothetical protein
VRETPGALMSGGMPAMSAAHCRYHCRACGSHFTSLEAFDAHREGPAGSHRTCTFPELPAGVELVEETGVCNLASDTAEIGVTIYALIRPGKYALEGRESAQGSGKRAA